MSFWGFLRSWFARAYHRSHHAGEFVHQLCIYIIAALVVYAIYSGVHAAHHEGEPGLPEGKWSRG